MLCKANACSALPCIAFHFATNIWQALAVAKAGKMPRKKRHAKHVLGTYELLLLKNFPSQKKKVRKLGPTRQRHQKYIELPCAIHKCLNACVNLKSVAMSKIKNDMSDAV